MKKRKNIENYYKERNAFIKKYFPLWVITIIVFTVLLKIIHSNLLLILLFIGMLTIVFYFVYKFFKFGCYTSKKHFGFSKKYLIYAIMILLAILFLMFGVAAYSMFYLNLPDSTIKNILGIGTFIIMILSIIIFKTKKLSA